MVNKQKDEIVEIRPENALESFREDKAVFVDVREPSEWVSGCIPNCFRIPLSNLSRGETDGSAALTALSAIDCPVIVYCRSGVRSLTGAKLLKTKLGRDDVYSMSGGILAWAGEVTTP